MSTADMLLARLEGVRPRGPSQWSALCPAHEDKSPSLSIRETETGALLVHCFAACEIADVLGAVGLEFADLYPERIHHKSRKDVKRPRLNGWAVVDAISFRLTCITLLANKLRTGKAFTNGDHRCLDESIVACQCAITEARRVR